MNYMQDAGEMEFDSGISGSQQLLSSYYGGESNIELFQLST